MATADAPTSGMSMSRYSQPIRNSPLMTVATAPRTVTTGMAIRNRMDGRTVPMRWPNNAPLTLVWMRFSASARSPAGVIGIRSEAEE